MTSSPTLYEPSTEHDSCGFGFVADIAGRPSHRIVRDALTVLVNLEHRGASGSEKNTGDGAGILVAIPHGFLGVVAAEQDLRLPERGYGVAMVFLPRDAVSRSACRQKFEATLASEGLALLGWRDVPTDPTGLGDSAQGSQPVIAQAFIGRPAGLGLTPEDDDLAFERRLYVARRLVEKAVTRSALPGRGEFYVPSMSCRTIVYKGMLNASQLLTFYPDLLDPRFASAVGLVHSRFSTNTFPSWSRAHPYRYISHNGEINTLRGNVNWMFARQSTFRSTVFGDDLQKILPAIDADGSDTTIFDNVLELLHLSGRSLAHVMMMMVPEPWGRDTAMSAERRAFYEYHSCLMEPWDGPASLAFTDGTRIGATLDRNGLRPGRYYVTKDGRVVMASEAGVLDIPPADVVEKGRLQPGSMFLVDTAQGRIIPDDELKAAITGARPYEQWVRESLVNLVDLPAPASVIGPDHETVLRRQEVFGYTSEDVRLIINPMAQTGADPIGSMGNDAPLAVLSERPQLLYNYFKQLFAQVTNPPVDAIREEIIMATDRSIGPEANLLEPGPEAAHQVAIPSPVISNRELEQIRALDGGPASHGFRTITLPILFKVGDNGLGLRRAIEDLRQRASEAISEGYNQVILSDRGHNETDAPIPALLAVSSVHHHLVRAGTRGRVGLVLESGEPREAHHFCLLIGYGASAINPYLAFETIDDQVRLGVIPGPYEDAEYRYRKAATKGVIKAISRMGISTVHSYHGAQVFEAIGLNRDFVDEYFTWTPTRIGGIGIEIVSKEVKARQDRAWPPHRPMVHTQLPPGGQYQWRADGENHLFNPLTIHTLQRAVRSADYGAFKDYSSLVDDQSTRLATLRGLLELRPALRAVPIDEVESVETIVKRFKTGAMSYGSISQEAHESLAIAMNRLGGKSNTGEGGEDPARYTLDENGDSRNSAIKQVASERFGVTSEYLVNARELQIKMAQGAKPGEGGQLPGSKVYPWIAKTRHSTPGVGLISPPPHHDIYSIEDLAELIYDLKSANHHARISVKLVAEVGVGTVAAGVAKAHADVVLISGHDGGTGASPLTSIKHAGIPWELGLAEAHQVLVMNDLRSRIVVEVDGQLKTGRDVVVGALLGAEEFGFATAPLVVSGC
ncbi:MAG: glutamate synthase large subunit, partial [Candidatus Limnocylindrales bacterium]